MRRNQKPDVFSLAILMLLAATAAAAAQGFHHPFAVGADEGAVGSASGITAWFIEQESRFSLALVGAMRAVKQSHYGFFALAGASFPMASSMPPAPATARRW